jgi:hypothetical protein
VFLDEDPEWYGLPDAEEGRTRPAWLSHARTPHTTGC